MYGVIIAAHGELAHGLLDAAVLIMGEQEKICCLSLTHGMDIEAFGRKLKEAVLQVDSEKGVIVFTDIFGASPFNQAVLLKPQLTKTSYRVVSGVNLPMLIEGLLLRTSEQTIEQVYPVLMEVGKESIREFESDFLKEEST